MSKKISYSEPKDFLPKEIRKKYGLGEFANEPKQDEKKKENEEVRKIFKGQK